MRAQFVIVPSLDVSSNLSEIRADMLVLGKFRNLELSALATFDERTKGIASAVLEEKAFIGEENQDVVLMLEPGDTQRRVMFAGLGRTQDYGCKVVAHVAQRAVVKSIKHGCRRIAMPFPAKRSTGGLSLKMQAHYIREAVEAAVAEVEGDDLITVELVCSKAGIAARELQKGIEMPVAGICCCKNKEQASRCQNS